MLAQFLNVSFNPDLTHEQVPQVWIKRHFQFQLAGMWNVEHRGAKHGRNMRW